MPLPIEDYAFLSDLESSCLVGKDGSIDWLTFPRFDSSACFSALLGGPEHGRWLVAPAGGERAVRRVARRYLQDSMVLETVFTTDEGEVAVIDCMPPRDCHLEVVRLVEGRRGRVPMTTEVVIRFDYGSIIPWVRALDGRMVAVGGPDSLTLTSPVPLSGHGLTSSADFTVGPGEVVPFSLVWAPAQEPARVDGDPIRRVGEARRWWEGWSARSTYEGPWREEVNQSLRVLKSLVYEPTGGLVAAPTTSLPELVGGPRNWDYRFCWLRDATFALLALLGAGYREEARAWRDWLLRATAGDPAQMQIMYGVAGERRLPELELDWLPGYQASLPVRTGNAASRQFQLDVYGEVIDALHQADLADGEVNQAGWDLQQVLVDFVEDAWTKPDEGIWEVRGPRRQFTHSKVMAWVAVDRAIRTAERFGVPADVDRWRGVRHDIKAWVLEHGVDDRGRFVQYEGSTDSDASLLMVPLVGFLPPDDPRVLATLEAIETELTVDGFVSRYRPQPDVDGLPAGEGAFLLCSFWLAQVQHLVGRRTDARATFERLLAVRNDVGLLAEQYDPATGHLLGNMPQAFSHTALVNTAALLSGADGHRTGAGTGAG